jgi:hypothetical protein
VTDVASKEPSRTFERHARPVDGVHESEVAEVVDLLAVAVDPAPPRDAPLRIMMPEAPLKLGEGEYLWLAVLVPEVQEQRLACGGAEDDPIAGKGDVLVVRGCDHGAAYLLPSTRRTLTRRGFGETATVRGRDAWRSRIIVRTICETETSSASAISFSIAMSVAVTITVNFESRGVVME